MALTSSPFEHDRPALQTARLIALFLALSAYVTLAAFATVIYPPAAAVFILPFALGAATRLPQGRALPRAPMVRALNVAVFLAVLWPVYLHVKIGPLPIITPSRLVMYALTALWLLDIGRSSLRRAQLVHAVKRSPVIAGGVIAFFILGALSLPLAVGRSIAAPEFFRQTIIWLLPFGVALTYLRTHRELLNLMKWALAGAIVSAGIAVMEFGTGTLMASVLSPLIPDNAEWLRTAQAQKIRDGVFRAQANHTHPLSLGEFLAMCAPFAVGFAIAAKRGFPRAFWAAAFLLIVAGSLATSSRAALLSLIVALGAMGAILLHRAQQRPRLARFRPMIGLAAFAVILVSPVMAVGAMALIGGSGGQSASNSTEARVEQIKQAWPKILKRPVLGYGVGRAARILGFWGRGLTIDNYYLSLALELGLLGPLVFLSIFIGLAVVAGKRSARGDPEIRYLYMAFVASAVSLLVTRSVISLTGNLGVIFVLLGAFAGAGVRDAAARRRQPALAAADEVDEIPRHEPGRAIAKYV